MTDSWIQSRDAQIAALQEKVRELEARLTGIEPPAERGFIIAGKFSEELFDEQASWLTEIETMARGYGTIIYSNMVDAINVDMTKSTVPVIYFTPNNRDDDAN